MVTQKTPLFDRAIPGRGSGLSSDSPVINTTKNNEYIDNQGINNTTSGTIKNINTKINNPTAETIIDQPVIQGLSCTTPRGTQLSDDNSIIAYNTQRATTDNKCYSEIRICQNGKLGGNFIYRTCDYIIDGQLIRSDGKREDIIVGASNSDQRLINLSKFYKKIQSTPKEYIQPQPYKNSSSLTTTQALGQKMNNSTIITNQDLTDILDQTTTQDDFSTDTGNCSTPRGKKIVHGSFVYAYNVPTNTIEQQCIAQKRTCNNGILGGSYKYESCRFNTNNTIPQVIIHSQASNIYRGTISPYSPYTRTIGDSIRDTVLTSHQNTNGSTSQNYIKISNCLTPWGSSIPDGGYTTAYRLPTQTTSSLCDSERRICRSGTLEGRYIYPACNNQGNTTSSSSQETWVGRNIKSIGKDATNIRGWIKGWFN